jgi:hypothetical protein
MPSLCERRRRVKAASSMTIDHRTDKARQATASRYRPMLRALVRAASGEAL